MFEFLSKFLPLFIYPTSLAAILLLAALAVRRARWRARLLAAGIGLILVLGNSWVSDRIVRSLEWRYLPQESYPQVDAIVILGGGTHPADYPRPLVEVSGAGDRLIYGARLFKDGYAPLVIVTGGELSWDETAGSPAEDMAMLLGELGVPQDVILVEPASMNTYENALLTRRLAEPLGIETILLVTSAMHMPRSIPLFEAQGFTVIPAPTDYLSTRPGESLPLNRAWPDLLFSLFPSPFALADTTLAMKEYLGIAFYALRGWR